MSVGSSSGFWLRNTDLNQQKVKPPPVHSPKFQIGVREGDYKLVWGQPSALHRSYREAKEEGGLTIQRPVLELYNLRQGRIFS